MRSRPSDPVYLRLVDIARLLHVDRQVVQNWRSRYRSFPRPAIPGSFPTGSLWLRCDIVAWALKNLDRRSLDIPEAPRKPRRKGKDEVTAPVQSLPSNEASPSA